MFYRKNVGTVERVARVLAAALLVACAFTAFSQTPVKWVFLAAGAMTLITGIMGFCPMCAIAGRKSLDESP
jgi:hypothetical protein